MAFIGGPLAAAILKRYEWLEDKEATAYENRSKVETLLGPDVWNDIRDKVVLDFGCKFGLEAMEMASRGAREVIGVDIVENYLAAARTKQEKDGIPNCRFVQRYEGKVDVITSLDAFEHFGDPDEILRIMAGMLRPSGKVLISFGPPWYHPYGGHMPLFPWAHVLLTERALMKWRSQYKTDGATRFGEVEGGLNQMSINRFERVVARSPFRFERFEAVPMRHGPIPKVHNRLTREFLTSVVRCVLVHRAN
jgi:SAM-dependent methyltransferase